MLRPLLILSFSGVGVSWLSVLVDGRLSGLSPPLCIFWLSDGVYGARTPALCQKASML